MNRDNEKFSEEEIARRRDEALLRALSTPPKPHSEMKIGKGKAKPSKNPTTARPASKGRVHKGE
jgi:hypothetical protein